MAKALGPSLGIVVAFALAACNSGGTHPSGDAQPGVSQSCGAAVCPQGASCVCPGDARSCASGESCATLCTTASNGDHICPTGGSCVLRSFACCQGVANCTLTCLHDYVCGP